MEASTEDSPNVSILIDRCPRSCLSLLWFFRCLSFQNQVCSVENKAANVCMFFFRFKQWLNIIWGGWQCLVFVNRETAILSHSSYHIYCFQSFHGDGDDDDDNVQKFKYFCGRQQLVSTSQLAPSFQHLRPKNHSNCTLIVGRLMLMMVIWTIMMGRMVLTKKNNQNSILNTYQLNSCT